MTEMERIAYQIEVEKITFAYIKHEITRKEYMLALTALQEQFYKVKK